MKRKFNPIGWCRFIIVLILIVPACRRKEKVTIRIERMEQALFSIPPDSVAACIPEVEKQFGELFELYNHKVIAIGAAGDPDYPSRLKDFITDPYMRDAYDKVTAMYPDLRYMEKELGEAFSNYHKFFPDHTIPRVYTLTSGFNQSMIVTDTILAIALDKYLGKDEEMYRMMDLALYQRKLMDKKYIVPDCMKAWAYTEFPYEDPNENILGRIMYEGKIIYFLQQVLPETPDSLLFGFTPAQMVWCRENTKEMWTFLVEKKLLFSTDYMILNKLTGPAPFTSFFTRESPGRAAIWLGYQMIRSYMKHNKVPLIEFLEDHNYQNMLAKAKFRP